MPLVGYHLLGFDRQPMSYGRADHALLQRPDHRERVEVFFSRTRYPFNVIFLNCDDQGSYFLRGALSAASVARVLGEVREDHHSKHPVWSCIDQDAVNFLFVNNRTGPPQIPITPWIIAHRMGHTPLLHAQEPRIVNILLYWNYKILKSCYHYDMMTTRRCLDTHRQQTYDKQWFYKFNPYHTNDEPDLRIFHGLYRGMTTSRSARTGTLRFGECVAEWFAQFIRHGMPLIGTLPETVDFNLGTGVPDTVVPNKMIDIENRDQEEQLRFQLTQALTVKFHEILTAWRGKIIVT